MENNIKSKIAEIAKKQTETCITFKQPRLNDIKKFFDLYVNKVDKALPGRFNVPIPVVGGLVDTLKSKIDDQPSIKFVENDETDYKRVAKANAMWQWDSSPIRGKWAMKDRASKISAIFTGRSVLSYFAESDPEYTSNLEVVDLFDFIFEPQGGADLDNHLFLGQTNIFKTESNLQDGVKAGLYDAKQVETLVSAQNGKDTKEVEDEFQNKVSRFDVYGLDPNTNNYVGENIYSLTQLFTYYKGKRYYILFDLKSGVWLRVEPIEEVFKSKLQPYVSWATHEDYFNFLSKGIMDDVKPIADAIRIIFNQALDNVQKRNWDMKAYDADIFPNPAELQYRPDGLIKAHNLTGKSIQNGVYQFQTPDNTNITVNLTEYLEKYIEKTTGITASAKGAEEGDQKVGIYYGNLQEVADRLGLYNKSYTESYSQLGIRYLYGLDEHLTENISVKVLGINGVEWQEVKRTDFKFERMPDVTVESSSAESQLDEAKNQRQQAALTMLTANPLLINKVNPDWLTRQILKSGQYSDENIRVAMDTINDGNAEILSEAAIAIKEILTGESPKPNRGATTAFVQKILDYDIDHNLKPEISDKLRAYASAHIEIAIRNMMRKATQMAAKQPMPGGGMPGASPLPQEGMPPQQPPVGTPQGTASLSQRASNIAQGV